MNTLLRLVMSSALIVSLAFPVYAGKKLHREVYLGTTFMKGDIGSVRNSADNVQYIGCNDFGTYIYCYGKSASGVTKTCASTSAQMIQQIRGLRTNAHIVILFNTAGACTSINTYQGSYAEQSEN